VEPVARSLIPHLDAARGVSIPSMGSAKEAIAWRDRARASLEGISDPADREVIEGDLAMLPR
jgi:hypothetical protein